MKCSSPYHLFFTNLANPLKVDIIMSLQNGEKNVTELSGELDVEQSKLSHALASLKDCKMVNSKQNGKERIYSLDKKTIIPILNLIKKNRENICKGCVKK